MRSYTVGVKLLMCALVATSVALGLPVYHYVTALMVALLIRHGRGANALFTPLRGGVPPRGALTAATPAWPPVAGEGGDSTNA